MDTKNVMQTRALQTHGDLAQKASLSTPVVADEIALATATAEWGYQEDERGRDMLVLHLRDTLGAEAQAQFSPAELENEQHLRARLQGLLLAAVQVRAWRKALRQLYDEVGQWCQQRSPPAIVQEDSIELNEERSGPYQVPMLRIMAEGRAADLEPIAGWVVGADGRVDLRGAGGREVLILEENEADKWSWVSDRATARLQELTNDLFLQLLDGVLQ